MYKRYIQIYIYRGGGVKLGIPVTALNECINLSPKKYSLRTAARERENVETVRKCASPCRRVRIPAPRWDSQLPRPKNASPPDSVHARSARAPKHALCGPQCPAAALGPPRPGPAPRPRPKKAAHAIWPCGGSAEKGHEKTPQPVRAEGLSRCGATRPCPEPRLARPTSCGRLLPLPQ